MSRRFVVLGLGLLLGVAVVGCRSEMDAPETGESTGSGGEHAPGDDGDDNTD
jgi:hypothetical protein